MESPRRGRGDAATLSQRNSRVAAAASPRSSPRNLHVAAAASPRFIRDMSARRTLQRRAAVVLGQVDSGAAVEAEFYRIDLRASASLGEDDDSFRSAAYDCWRRPSPRPSRSPGPDGRRSPLGRSRRGRSSRRCTWGVRRVSAEIRGRGVAAIHSRSPDRSRSRRGSIPRGRKYNGLTPPWFDWSTVAPRSRRSVACAVRATKYLPKFRADVQERARHTVPFGDPP